MKIENNEAFSMQEHDNSVSSYVKKKKHLQLSVILATILSRGAEIEGR